LQYNLLRTSEYNSNAVHSGLSIRASSTNFSLHDTVRALCSMRAIEIVFICLWRMWTE